MSTRGVRNLVLGGIAILALACGTPGPSNSTSNRSPSTSSSSYSPSSSSSSGNYSNNDQSSGSSVPSGEYSCYQQSASSGYLYFGKVKFESGHQYEATPGGSGHYTMTSGGDITFTDGVYADNGWDGEYHPNDGSAYKSDTVVLDPSDLKISCHT